MSLEKLAERLPEKERQVVEAMPERLLHVTKTGVPEIRILHAPLEIHRLLVHNRLDGLTDSQTAELVHAGNAIGGIVSKKESVSPAEAVANIEEYGTEADAEHPFEAGMDAIMPYLQKLGEHL